jgi:hypothetical protein
VPATNHIAWERGGEASVVRLDGDAIALRSSIPSPPGSRIQGVLTVALGDGLGDGGAGQPAVVRVKVHSSKRQEDGTFLLDGRVLDLTRAVRDQLARGV